MLKQPDAAEFIKATTKEANDHECRDHLTVIPRSENYLVSRQYWQYGHSRERDFQMEG